MFFEGGEGEVTLAVHQQALGATQTELGGEGEEGSEGEAMGGFYNSFTSVENCGLFKTLERSIRDEGIQSRVYIYLYSEIFDVRYLDAWVVGEGLEGVIGFEERVNQRLHHTHTDHDQRQHRTSQSS